MDIFDSIKSIYRFSRIFGSAPYTIKAINGKTIFLRNKKYNFYVGLIFLFFIPKLYISIKYSFIDINQIKSSWSRLTYILDMAVYLFHLILTPINFLMYKSLLCQNLNKINTIKIANKIEEINMKKLTN